MKGIMDIRAIELANYIVANKTTVRATAKKFGISKSTVHKDVTDRLTYLNPQLKKEVKLVLDTNKAECTIRGGLATKEKYERLSLIAPY